MSFYRNAIRDDRSREYVPVRRIVCSAGVEGPEHFVGRREIQNVIHYFDTTPKPVSFAPGGAVVLDFGIELHGGIRICMGSPGGRVRINFGESVSETLGMPNQDCSIKQAVLELPVTGMLEYGNSAFRFVRIENVADGKLDLFNVAATAVFRDLEYAGSFESSDERLNRIWKTGAYTVQLCMQDFLYDGAKRDRIVWMGDMHPEIRTILNVFKDVSLITRSLDFLIERTPFPHPMNKIWTYSCWFIVSLADYYRISGDYSYLERHADYIEEVLRQYTRFVGPDGAECIPERRFLDWPNNDNLPAKHAGIQALLLWMFQSGIFILESLGRDARFLRESLKTLKKHVPDCAGSKAAAALQTLTGLADRRSVLEKDPFRGVSTFYGFYMLLAKDTGSALDLIRRYWGAMLDFGATTFWEDFDLDWIQNASRIDEPPVPGKKDLHADFGNYCYQGLRHSFCHGWASGPTTFLSERILGVRFLEPGGKRILVQPDLGNLEFVRGEVPTPQGPVTVAADASGRIQVNAPKGTEIEQTPHPEVSRSGSSVLTPVF